MKALHGVVDTIASEWVDAEVGLNGPRLWGYDLNDARQVVLNMVSSGNVRRLTDREVEIVSEKVDATARLCMATLCRTLATRTESV